MIRREDWMERLRDAVREAQSIRFTYGVHDCCLWAAHCVDKMCDTDITRKALERFNYSDEESAGAIIDAAGGLPLLISEFLGDPVRAAFAMPGDVVLARNEHQHVIGVMVGHSIVAPSADGLLSLPFASGVLCWKV